MLFCSSHSSGLIGEHPASEISENKLNFSLSFNHSSVWSEKIFLIFSGTKHSRGEEGRKGGCLQNNVLITMKRSTLCGLTQTHHIGHYSVNKHYVYNAADLATGRGPVWNLNEKQRCISQSVSQAVVYWLWNYPPLRCVHNEAKKTGILNITQY